MEEEGGVSAFGGFGRAAEEAEDEKVPRGRNRRKWFPLRRKKKK